MQQAITYFEDRMLACHQCHKIHWESIEATKEIDETGACAQSNQLCGLYLWMKEEELYKVDREILSESEEQFREIWEVTLNNKSRAKTHDKWNCNPTQEVIWWRAYVGRVT